MPWLGEYAVAHERRGQGQRSMGITPGEAETEARSVVRLVGYASQSLARLARDTRDHAVAWPRCVTTCHDGLLPADRRPTPLTGWHAQTR